MKLKGVGAALKAMRQEAGKTQEQTAELLGWSQDALSKRENNRLDLSACDIVLIAQALKLPLGDVFLRCLKELHQGAPEHPNGILAKDLLNRMDNNDARE